MTPEEVLNANFAEKMRARSEKRVPSIVYPADPENTDSEVAVEARYRAKLEDRKAKPKADDVKSEAPKTESKPAPEGEGKPKADDAKSRK